MKTFTVQWIQLRAAALCALACLLLLPAAAFAQTLESSQGVQTYATLTNTTVTMTGKSELRVTAATNPIPGSVINLSSPDAWFLLTNIRPQTVASTYLSQIRVYGAPAVLGANVRVVQYELGAAVIPHDPAFQPLEAFSGPGFTGDSLRFSQYTYYNSAATLGALNRNISSFKLKRGYMATFSTRANGTGPSQTYVAQDGDFEVGLLPDNLNNAIQYVRVFPWRWVSKKGSCDIGPDILDSLWFYNWNNDRNSTLNWEYVPIRQQRYWPGLPTNKPDSTHLSGFNEPDNSVEDAYKTLDNGSVDTAIAVWPELLATGLRVGSPAVTDGGESWLYSFIDKADAANLRVDYVTIHFYRCGYTATQLYDWLYNIHVRTGRPLWVTEFNNGANWTTCTDPTLAQNAATISSFIEMMDNAPFIERYAVYSAVEAVRQMVDGSGNLTPAGAAYKANASPIGYEQAIPATGRRGIARLPFENNTLDTSGYSNDGMAVGRPAYTTGLRGQAIALDGANSYVQMPSKIANGAAFSFAAWVNWDGGDNWQRLFDFGKDTSAYLFLTPRAGSGRMRFAIKNGGAEQVLEAPAALPSGQWTHVALTLGGGVARLYVNGALAATNSAMTITPGSFAPNHNFLGRSQFSADPLFDGRLEDVRIADSVFTPAEVAALMTATTDPTNNPPQFTANPILRGPARRGALFNGTIAGSATDPDAGDTITYAKSTGPAWLTVAANGTLSGTPTAADQGPQEFVVTATDSRGASDSAVLIISLQAFYWWGDQSNNWSTNNGGNTNWSTDAEGTTDTQQAPDAQSYITFAATGATNLPGTVLGADFSVRGVLVTGATGVTIGGSNNLSLGADGLTVSAGAGAVTINTAGQVALGGNQTWTNNTSNQLTVASPISGAAALTLSGAATTLFTGNNTYSGPTTISGGTLSVGNGGATGGIVGNVVDNGALIVNRSTDLTLDGVISGTGSLTKLGAGRLTLSNTNSYSGSTTIGGGGGAAVLRAGANNALGTGSLIFDTTGNASTARLELSGGVTLPNAAITLPQRNNTTVAIQNIAGNNRLSGAISLSAGGSSAIFQSDAGLLTLGAISSATGARTPTLTGAGNGVVSGVIANGSGTIALVKSGSGTWTLSGANTYTGTTTINAGTLALGAAERIANTSNPVFNGGVFATNGFSETLGTLTLSANTIIDMGSGAGTLTFSGPGTFTSGRTLTILNYSTGASRLFIGSSAVLSAAQLAQINFNGAAAQQLSTGEVVPGGTAKRYYWRGDVNGAWSANNAGNTNWATALAGTTDTAALPDAATDVIFAATGAANLPGTVLGADFSLKSLTVNSATAVGIGGTNNLTLGASGIAVASGAGAVTINTGGQVVLGANQGWSNASANPMTVSSVISGSGGLTKTGSGQLTLTGANIYTGGTTISAGTVQIGAGGTTGSLAGNIANEGALVVNRSDDLALDGAISGTGSLTKLGAGRLTLSNTNSYSGVTTIGVSGAGTRIGVIRAGANNALGVGEVVIGPGGNDATARLELSGGVTLPNAITLPMRNNTTAAIQNLGGSNALSGAISLTVGGANALFQSDAGLLTLSGAITSSATGPRAVTLTGAGNGVASAVISNGSATLSITKDGAGTWTISGANTYTGTTTINAGTLQLGGANRLPDASSMTLGGGAFATGGFSETLGALSLSESSTIDLGSGAGTLAFGGVGTFASGKTLNIANWTAGSDHLFIGGTAILNAAQLAQIKFGTVDARQLGTGEVVPASLPVAGLLVTLSLSRQGSEIVAGVTAANTGTVLATDAQVTSATLGSTRTSTPLPAALGDIPAGQSRTVTLRFAAPPGGTPVPPAGTPTLLRVNGTYSGGTFGGSQRVTVP